MGCYLPATLASNDQSQQLAPLIVSDTALHSTGASLDLDTPNNAGSRLGLSLRENPASVAIADQNVMKQVGARDLQDAVNTLPGINLASFPGQGAFASYRGFTNAQVNHLYNGIPLSYAVAARPVDVWIYDRVEAVGGPSSFLYGASSVGGSLNYVSKTAQRIDEEITGRLSYGRFDTTNAAIGINKALNDNNWIRFDYSHGTGNGYIDRNDRRADTLAFSWLADISDNLSHTLAVEYQEEKVDSPYWGTPVLQPRDGTLTIDKALRHRNYNVRDGHYEQRVRWLRSVTDYDVNTNTHIRNTLYHYRAERDYRNVEKYTFDANNTAVTRNSLLLLTHQQELIGNRIELTHQTELFNRRSDWAFGLDYNINHHTRYLTALDGSDVITRPDQFNPGYLADFGRSPLLKNRHNRVKMAAIFVENRQYLSDRVSLISALRYDHIDFESAAITTSVDFNQQWDTLSGRLGLMYEFNDNINLYAQYSTSAEPPGGTLTTSSSSTVDDFDISKGRQVELGTKFNYADDRGAATIAAYQIEREDFLISDPENPNQSLQVGKQSSLGLELASAFQFTPQLSANGNISFVRAKYDTFFEGSHSY